MDSERIFQRRLQNLALTVLTVAAMALLLGVVGAAIAGKAGFFLACVTGLIMALLGLRANQRTRLLVHGGRELDRWDAPELVDMTRRLAARAGLHEAPRLVYIATPRIMAFSFGTRHNASIAVTQGLLNQLSHSEMEGVLAHEISHLANGDVPLLMLSEYFFSLTAMLARIGFFILVLNLPLMAMTGTHIAWPLVVLLVGAPILSLLLKLSLSRTREFEADLNAAYLTGSPRGLMSALARIEYRSASWLERLFGMPPREVLIPKMLRTHPDTGERLRRLADLQRQATPGSRHGGRMPDGHGVNVHVI